MIRIISLLSCLFAAAAGASSSHVRDVSTAHRVLRDGPPHQVTWRYSQHVDINGDNERDEVFMSEDREHFYVGVVLGPICRSSVPSVVSFKRAGHSQDSFCGPFESLTPEKLATREELVEMVGEEPSDYPFDTAAVGLRLIAGGCDSFHLFWNSSAKALDWWRL